MAIDIAGLNVRDEIILNGRKVFSDDVIKLINTTFYANVGALPAVSAGNFGSYAMVSSSTPQVDLQIYYGDLGAGSWVVAYNDDGTTPGFGNPYSKIYYSRADDNAYYFDSGTSTFKQLSTPTVLRLI